MSSSSKISKYQFRDGASQQRRTPQALLPEYISIDERSQEDLLAFARDLAARMHYYQAAEEMLEEDGSWEEFFTDEVEDSAAHKALFITFLKLFNYAQQHINTLTKRHLDFYYRKVLHLKEKPPQADEVHLLFELAKNVKTHLLKAGTLLKAGKDKDGLPLYYATEKDIVINNAEIASLKTLFIGEDDSGNKLIKVSPVANSADGKGKVFEAENPQWEIFGSKEKGKEAVLGFAIASTQLFLKEGERTITLSITFKGGVPLPGRSFTIQLSSAEGWITIENDDSNNDNIVVNKGETVDEEGNTLEQLKWTFKLGVEAPPVTAFDKEIPGENFNTKLPLMKVLLTANQDYDSLRELQITKIELEVDVKEVKNLLVQNDHGILDPTKPFPPFSTQPRIGSSFYIGSEEVFQKKLNSLTLNIEWQDKPDFTTHYTEYGIDTNTFTALNFTAGIKLLYQNSWAKLKSDHQLFGSNHTIEDIPDQLEGKNENITNYQHQQVLQEIKKYDHNTSCGFIKLELSGPLTPFRAFGHAEYPALYTQQAMALSMHTLDEYLEKDSEGILDSIEQEIDEKDLGDAIETDLMKAITSIRNYLDGKEVGLEESEPPALPNEPYTPYIKSLTLDYTSTRSISFEEDTDTAEQDNTGAQESTTEQFFHIGPFGNSEQTKGSPLLLSQLAYEPTEELPEEDVPEPLDNHEGSLFIGIKSLEPPQTFSILFRPAEGSANHNLTMRQSDIYWSYLSGKQWKNLDRKQILSDTTKAFQAIGIITFSIPRDASLKHDLMPEDLHWLRASVTANASSIGNFMVLHPQAVTAKFINKGNDPSRLEQALAANSITGLAEKRSAIKSITQPYPSFNGKAAEQSETFYTRISERLRHKGRASTAWDYERLVLEEFPSIYKVKCLNHTKIGEAEGEEDSENEAGLVTLITLPDTGNKNAADPLRPATSNKTLIAIEEYIQKYTSPFTEVVVKNPVYEQLQLRFNVSFKEGVDQGHYIHLLEKELIRFLAPWAYDEKEDIVFGSAVHKSAILDFVEKKPYVDFVTNFVLYHIYKGELPLPNPERHSIDVYRIIYRYPEDSSVLALYLTVGLDLTASLDMNPYVEMEKKLGDFFPKLGGTDKEELEEFYKKLYKIKRADVMAYIEDKISIVTALHELRLFFKMEEDIIKEDTERAIATRPNAILTAYKEHEIDLIDSEAVEDTCQGTEITGVENMIIDVDFRVD